MFLKKKKRESVIDKIGNFYPVMVKKALIINELAALNKNVPQSTDNGTF
jgi:hypothetical protein